MADPKFPQLDITLTFPVQPLPDAVQAEAIQKAKEAFTMTLLKHGVISSGRAGRILDIPRLDVIDLMGKYEVSLFDDALDAETLLQEVKQAKAVLDRNQQ